VGLVRSVSLDEEVFGNFWPLIGGIRKGKIGVYDTNYGFLYERFEEENVEKLYQAWWRRRAVGLVMTSKWFLVPLVLYLLSVCEALLNPSHLSSVDVALLLIRVIFWALLFALRMLKPSNDMGTYSFVKLVACFYQGTGFITAAGQSPGSNTLRLGISTVIGSYLIPLRWHMHFVLTYTSLAAAGYVYTIYSENAANCTRAGQTNTFLNPAFWINLQYHLQQDASELAFLATAAVVSVFVVGKLHHEARMRFALGGMVGR